MRSCFAWTGARAVVIGTGSGIGRESALALAAQGADVVCADRNMAAAQETAGFCGGVAVELNVLDAAAVRQAAEDLGAVDVLVFTAATNVRKRLLDYSSEEFLPGGGPEPAGLLRRDQGLRGWHGGAGAGGRSSGSPRSVRR